MLPGTDTELVVRFEIDEHEEDVEQTALPNPMRRNFVKVDTIGVKTRQLEQPTPAHSVRKGTSHVLSFDEKPFAFEWIPNYPNPFDSKTEIRYRLPECVHVKLEVLDVTGRCLTILVDEYQNSGIHSVYWHAINKSDGLYFCRLTAGDFSTIRRMVLMK